VAPSSKVDASCDIEPLSPFRVQLRNRMCQRVVAGGPLRAEIPGRRMPRPPAAPCHEVCRFDCPSDHEKMRAMRRLTWLSLVIVGLASASGCSSDANPPATGHGGAGGSGPAPDAGSSGGAGGAAGSGSLDASSPMADADATPGNDDVGVTNDAAAESEADLARADADAEAPPNDGATDASTGRVPRQGLVLYLRLDDSPAASAFDEVSGTKGAAQNCTSVAGKVGAAFDFTGKNVNAMMQSSLIQFPDRPALNPTTAITVGAWIRPRTGDMGGGPRILQKGYNASDQDTQYRFILNGTQVALLLFNQGSTAAISAPMPPLNEWHHVAITWDGATGAGIVYVDGTSKRQTTYRGAIGTSNMPLFIGTKHDKDVVTNWDGALDEIVIYDRALTAPEVAQLAQP
jgi:Concanavalin A-like lectin/glucanases superfamily